MAADRSRPARATHALADLAATQELARRLAGRARTGDVIGLGGGLGAGKTAFARAFVNAVAAAHGAPPEEVPSPTFTLAQVYPFARLTLFHFDLYRIDHADEAFELGIEEAFVEGVSLIEWPERMAPLLPPDRLELVLRPGPSATGRIAVLTGHGGWRSRLAGLAAR